MKTVDLTLKAYVEVYLSRWDNMPWPPHPLTAERVRFLKSHRIAFLGCDLTADEVLTYLWWNCECHERRLVCFLAYSYRSYCAHHGLRYETITFKMTRQ